MKSMKGKNIFIKDNITGDVDATSGYIKTLDTFMKGTIA
jgi:hypothetical protein